ncbi:MAG TPA: O-antigen ligase family protein [Candidatus Methylomirabilis sp.]|nr:O-antigen ligase family protein [Candidatus Methylomirabilis sp.]
MTTPTGRFDRLVIATLIVVSMFTDPFARVATVALTGDRVLGLAALVALPILLARRRHAWTAIHTALGIFVVVQILTSLANVGTWPSGLRFVSIYPMGFACFALTVQCAGAPDVRRFAIRLLVVTGAIVGLIAALAAGLANLWGSRLRGSREMVIMPDARPIFVGRVMFREQNFLGSFLLLPFTLELWAPRSISVTLMRARTSVWQLVAIVFGIVFSFTRAAWLAAAAIIGLWWCSVRPRGRTLFAIVAIAIIATAVLVMTMGTAPLVVRSTKIVTGVDRTLGTRVLVDRAVLRSSLEHPLIGQGAGSVNRLWVLGLRKRTVEQPWTGNMELHVLHDSGFPGLAALVGVGLAVVRAVRRRRAAARDEEWRSVVKPLVIAGLGIFFAFQFTHGLWLMFPYVFLGLLTAALDTSGKDARAGA